jgi:hypothetical protein
MRFPVLLSTLALCLAFVPATTAQLRVDQPAPSAVLDDLGDDVPVIVMPAVNVATYLAEDAAAGRSAPFRFGAEIPVELDLKALGSVSMLPDGGTVWRLALSAPGATVVGLEFSGFDLPVGAGLWLHAADGSETLGAYTALNNKDNREFAIQPVDDDGLVLEYVEPADVDRPGVVVIGTVIHGYRELYTKGGYAGASGNCNVDVNCPQGAPYANEKQAVARIVSGGILCTGSLINNTANDGTQYFWTANHCGGMNNAVFLFNYEKSGCGSGSAPGNQSVQGSTLIASNSSVDYRLVRITENIPASYQPYFLGWNRGGTAPSSTVTIHHPSGDVRKISFDNQAPTKSGTDWRVAEWDLGVTEGGSSGCPLMNAAGQFIGQLCCGQAFCGFPFNDYYGRMDLAWSGVQSALDPVGSNPVSFSGYDPDGPGAGSWTTLGGGLAGILGEPDLVGSGPLTGGSTVTLTLSGTLSFKSAALVVGASQANIPFKSGVIVPSPDILFLNLPTANGGYTFQGAWPVGVPSGTDTYFQYWINDQTGPQGFTASHAVEGTTP